MLTGGSLVNVPPLPSAAMVNWAATLAVCVPSLKRVDLERRDRGCRRRYRGKQHLCQRGRTMTVEGTASGTNLGNVLAGVALPICILSCNVPSVTPTAPIAVAAPDWRRSARREYPVAARSWLECPHGDPRRRAIWMGEKCWSCRSLPPAMSCARCLVESADCHDQREISATFL